MGVSDEVYYPPLSCVLIHVKFLCQCARAMEMSRRIWVFAFTSQLPDINSLMNAAVCLEDEKTGVLNEFVAAGDQEKIIRQDLWKTRERVI